MNIIINLHYNLIFPYFFLIKLQVIQVNDLITMQKSIHTHKKYVM